MGYFERNLELVRTTHRPLAEKIGKAVAVPVEESDHLPPDFLDELGTRGIVFLMGIGSGRIAADIACRLTDKQAMVIFEADLGVLRYAMSRRSLAKVFALPSLMLFTEEITDYTFLQPMHLTMANEVCLEIQETTSIALHPEVYERTMKRIMEEKQFYDINLGTSVSLGRKFMDSILSNVPAILRSRGAGQLFGLFPDCPAIICSSGPSLDYEYKTLRNAKGKCLVISIDTCLPLLLAHGVIPDLVCGIDPLPDNKVLFKKHRGLLKDIPAVLLAQYTPEILASYPGPLFVASMPGNMVYNWLSPFWEEKGPVECFGGSVSHFATQLADLLGCATIALTGQDLCYKQKYHAGNITKLLHDGMGLEEPDETKIGMPGKNRKGEAIYTKPHLQSFRTAFENKIRTSPHLKIVNTSVDGVKIEGAEFMRLKTFVRKYGIEIDTKAAFDFVRTREPHHARDVLIESLTNAIRIFDKISRTSLTIIGTIRKIKALRSQKGRHKEEIRALVKKVEHLRPITQHPITALISGYYHHIEVYLHKSQIKDIDQIKHKWVRLDAQLERGLNFYGELREACMALNGELRRLQRRLAKEEKAGIRDERTANTN